MMSSTHSFQLCPDPRSQPLVTAPRLHGRGCFKSALCMCVLDYGSAFCVGGLSTTILRSKHLYVGLLVTHLWQLWICNGGAASGKWQL
ncbi:hypothetical protein PRUPE_6G130200 [Prunus persica]|uniref:Uncharacterized protein n=1 Tax=Prunus persica TaxID=3760 RepID=A0A251NPL9_PRUPE|nr:hypothetical protein PRUPE_6G130200 [Prunus persica]